MKANTVSEAGASKDTGNVSYFWILLTFLWTQVNLLTDLLFKATSGSWKQLQTGFSFIYLILPKWQPSWMINNTAYLGLQWWLDRWLHLGVCVCVCVCARVFFLCRWLHHRRHRVLLEGRRVGRDGGDADRVASVLHCRLQAGLQERSLFHR